MSRFFRILCLCACLAGAASQQNYQIYVLEQSCGSGNLNVTLTKSGNTSSGIMKATNKISYSFQMRCKVMLLAPSQYRVVVSIREIGLRKDLLGICKDYLEVDGEPICETIYREDEERHYWSRNNVMTLLYHTSPDGLNNKTLSGYPGFTLTFTALKKATLRNCTSADRFLCANDFCIWSGLTCDGHNNCGDMSDEDAYGDSNCGRSGKGSTVLIVLAVLIVLVLLLMCVATLLCTKNETVRRFSSRLRSRTLSFIPSFR